MAAATKKRPDPDPDPNDGGEDQEDDPKEGIEFETLDSGVRIPIPQEIPVVRHTMELSTNPAIVAQTPSYLYADDVPMAVSPRNTGLMMLPDSSQEERVNQYEAERQAHIDVLNNQISVAQDAVTAMEAVPAPPPPPEPPEPEPTEELLLLPPAAEQEQAPATDTPDEPAKLDSGMLAEEPADAPADTPPADAPAS